MGKKYQKRPLRVYMAKYLHCSTCTVDLGVERWVIISMMVTCDASVVVRYDRRILRLCNTSINRQYDNNITEE